MVRAAYGCDCDGVSHRLGAVEHEADHAGMIQSVRAALGAIESVVGVRPSTCPWRAFYDPLVVEVLDVCTLAEKSLGASYLGADPPAVLVDAVALYLRCRDAALAHNLEQQRKKSEAERAAQAARQRR